MSGAVAAAGLKVACRADFSAAPGFPSEAATNRPDGGTEAVPIPSRNVNNNLEALSICLCLRDRTLGGIEFHVQNFVRASLIQTRKIQNRTLRFRLKLARGAR